MKPIETKQEYIQLRAEGKSYDEIAKQLHISKSTCTAWETELGEEIAKRKTEELNSLYEAYNMKKSDRIKKLGHTLEGIEDALDSKDLTELSTDKLLEYKLKYTEALKAEYVSTEPAIQADVVTSRDILTAYADLFNRTRNGEITATQAQRENYILSNLLKAYETTEVSAKLDRLEAIIEGRQ